MTWLLCLARVGAVLGIFVIVQCCIASEALVSFTLGQAIVILFVFIFDAWTSKTCGKILEAIFQSAMLLFLRRKPRIWSSSSGFARKPLLCQMATRKAH